MSVGPLLVIAGAVVGAPLRHAIAMRFDTTRAPWGIFAVNVVGSFLLGLLVGADPTNRWYLLLGVGFCGSLTTWSTLANEVWKLSTSGRVRDALVYLVSSIGWGLGAFLLGLGVF
ncbi:hypothetical protein BH09ACT10_BH09ACT10_17670 [soil metagenome]